ncbi:MAG: phosphoribosylglycinamide formyltransferase, partial [Pseudomonadota bacterium]
MATPRKIDPPPRARVAVLLSGRGSNMAALLYAAQAEDCPYEVCLVAANDPDAPGLAIAAAEGVTTWAKSHKGLERAAFDALIGAAVEDAGADYIALAGYMRLLSPEFVARWDGRMLNVHPSLLPKYKGLDTHGRAIANGDTHGGCSVHLVTAEVDDGPVLGQTKVAIAADDTPATLAARVQLAEHQLFPRILASYIGRARDPAWLTARIGDLALALPETQYRESHGAPGWRVGSASSGKYFAYISDHHHGEQAVALLVKTSGQDEMATLIEAEPELYYRPAYYGASGWIAIR